MKIPLYSVLKILIVLFLTVPLYGQPDKSKIDDLTKQVAAYPVDDSLGLATRVILANLWIYYSIDSATYYIDQVLNQPNKELLLSSENQCKALLIKGWTFQGQNKLKEARDWMKKCHACTIRNNDAGATMEVLTNIVSTFSDELSPQTDSLALDILGRLDTAESRGQQELQVFLMLLRAKSAEHLRQYEKAVDLVLETLEYPIIQDPLFGSYIKPGLFNVLSLIASSQGNSLEAIDLMKLALKDRPTAALGNTWIAVNLASIFQRYGQLDSAEHYLSLIPIEQAKGESCMQINAIKSKIAYSKKEYQKALTYARGLNCNNRNPDAANQFVLKDLIFGSQLKLGRIAEASITLQHLEELFQRNKDKMNTDYERSLARNKLLLKMQVNSANLLADFEDYQRADKAFYEEKNNEITQATIAKFSARLRQDSIANLTLRSQAAETAATNRQRQLWLVLALLAAVGGGLIFATRESRRRKQLNEALSERNNRITLLNKDINHRTSGYLFNIIKLLKEQRFKLEDAGADPSVLDELERQTLVYTKLQSLLTTVDDRTVVNLNDYLQELTALLHTSFEGSGMPILTTLNTADVNIDPKLAAPLALVLNELMTNTAKYAIRRSGVAAARFEAALIEENTLLLHYEDDGPDTNRDTSEHFSSNTGLDLIEGLTHQMEAERLVAKGYNYRAKVEL